jgi:hypothetical protein
VLPSAVLKATLEPAIGQANPYLESFGWSEFLNPSYGMARGMAVYRGHLFTFHGGDLTGFHSQISFMPKERLGVIVFVLGNHDAMLYNPISYNVYEYILGLDQTPWPARMLAIRKRLKQSGTAARARAGADRVPDTHPSHDLEAFTGEYVHPAYGTLRIGREGDHLAFEFHKIKLPLSHYHYDRFDTPDDELDGKWSVNFQTSAEGDVDKVVMSLDEAEAVFVRRVAPPDPALVQKLVGNYGHVTKVQIRAKPDGSLVMLALGKPEVPLIPFKGLQFRVPKFSDRILEFVLKNDQVKALKVTEPEGVSFLDRMASVAE